MWVSKETECPFYDNFKLDVEKVVEKMDRIELVKKENPCREVTNNDIYKQLDAALNKDKGGMIKTFLDAEGRPIEGDKLAKTA